MKLSIHSLILRLACMGVFDWMDDEQYLRLMYWGRMHKKLNLDPPETFNEKIQWLKLNDRDPNYAKMVDKYAVKKYAADIIGDQYIIPTIGVWKSFDKIDFDTLPDKFVLKCTHDSGGLVICRNKKELDIESARKKIEVSLNKSYYKYAREWPYSLVEPRIIAEMYMQDGENQELKDYKLMCFNGRAEYVLVCEDRFSPGGLMETFYDREWHKAEFRRPNTPENTKGCKRPELFGKMICLAEKLSKDITFSRIDFYEVNGRLYFGEITLFPASGFSGFEPEEWDKKLGDMIKLPSWREKKS